MDARLAFGALLALPALFALARALTLALPPLAGAGVALAIYWAALAAAIRATTDIHTLRELLVATWPGRLIALTLALPVVVLGAGTMRLLGQAVLPPHLILAAALAAVLHATLEEAFWRGALLPRPTPGAAALALLLYWAFHLAWIGLVGLSFGLDPVLLVFAPLALGGVWTAARLATDTLGAGVMGHAGVALFLFLGVLARGWTGS